jgi:large subunit ribosomal protein L9
MQILLLLLIQSTLAYQLPTRSAIAQAPRSPSPSVLAKKSKPKLVQVVLSEPVKGVGEAGECVAVKAAYADNVREPCRFRTAPHTHCGTHIALSAYRAAHLLPCPPRPQFIVRGGKGVLATPEKLRQLAAEAAAAEAAAASAKAAALEARETLTAAFGSNGLLVPKNAGPDGAIFGSVTAAEVAQLVAERTGVRIEKRQVEVPKVDRVGTATATLRLHKDVTLAVSLVVTPAAAG